MVVPLEAQVDSHGIIAIPELHLQILQRTVNFVVGSLEIQSGYALNSETIGDNTFFNGTNQKYRASGFGNMINFSAGNIYIQSAPSGTAGATATFIVNAAFLNNGHVSIGTTTDNGGLTVAGTAVPEANLTRDLGTSSFAWRDVYFSHPVGKTAIGVSSSLGTNVSSLTPSGNDGWFKLTLVTSGAVSGGMGSIAFGRTWGATPSCVISSADATTASAVCTFIRWVCVFKCYQRISYDTDCPYNNSIRNLCIQLSLWSIEMNNHYMKQTNHDLLSSYPPQFFHSSQTPKQDSI